MDKETAHMREQVLANQLPGEDLKSISSHYETFRNEFFRYTKRLKYLVIRT